MTYIKYVLFVAFFIFNCIYGSAQVTPVKIQNNLLIKGLNQKMEVLKKNITNFSVKNRVDYNAWKKGKFIQPNNLGGKDSMFIMNVLFQADTWVHRAACHDRYLLVCKFSKDEMTVEVNDYVDITLRTESTKEYTITFHIGLEHLKDINTHFTGKWVISHFVAFVNNEGGGTKHEYISYEINDIYNGTFSILLSPKQLIKEYDSKNSYPITERISIWPMFVDKSGGSGTPPVITWEFKGIEVKEIQ